MILRFLLCLSLSAAFSCSAGLTVHRGLGVSDCGCHSEWDSRANVFRYDEGDSFSVVTIYWPEENKREQWFEVPEGGEAGTFTFKRFSMIAKVEFYYKNGRKITSQATAVDPSGFVLKGDFRERHARECKTDKSGKAHYLLFDLDGIKTGDVLTLSFPKDAFTAEICHKTKVLHFSLPPLCLCLERYSNTGFDTFIPPFDRI